MEDLFKEIIYFVWNIRVEATASVSPKGVRAPSRPSIAWQKWSASTAFGIVKNYVFILG